MNAAAGLKTGIIVWWASIAIYLSLSFALESALPETLQSYLAMEYEREITAMELGVLIFGLFIIVIQLVSSVALFRQKIWAAKPFIITSVFGFILVGFIGPSVEHAVAATFSYFESACIGFIIAIILFSDALDVQPNNK